MQEVESVKLRELREQLGLTQQELAERLGMARTYISMIESETKPFSKKMRRKVEGLLYERDNFGSIHAENGGVVSYGDSAKIRTAAPQVSLEAKLNIAITYLERIAIALEKLAAQ